MTEKVKATLEGKINQTGLTKSRLPSIPKTAIVERKLEWLLIFSSLHFVRLKRNSTPLLLAYNTTAGKRTNKIEVTLTRKDKRSRTKMDKFPSRKMVDHEVVVTEQVIFMFSVLF